MVAYGCLWCLRAYGAYLALGLIITDATLGDEQE